MTHQKADIVNHRNLFFDLLWPAAAGNIVWSIYDCSIDIFEAEQIAYNTFLPLLLVIVLGVYACEYWVRGSRPPGWQLWQRCFHLFFLTTSAVMIAKGLNQIALFSFIAFFGFNVIFHLLSLKTPVTTEVRDMGAISSERVRRRVIIMTFANAIGAVFGVIAFLSDGIELLMMFLGALIPVCVWIFVNKDG